MRLRLLLVVLGILAGGTGAPLASGPAAASGVTFNREIAPLLQQHCQECHRPGGSAPFELIKYEHVYRRRDKILAAVEKRSMPPWKALQGYGEFIGERRLSDAEVAMVARWVADGAPEGDARDLPTPRQFSSSSLGDKPDLVLRPDQPFTVPGRSGDIYRCFSVATSFTEDRYFTAADVVPGTSKIVHHVLSMADGSGRSANIPSATAGTSGAGRPARAHGSCPKAWGFSSPRAPESCSSSTTTMRGSRRRPISPSCGCGRPAGPCRSVSTSCASGSSVSRFLRARLATKSRRSRSYTSPCG